MARARTFRVSDRVQAFAGVATHFGVCVNWQAEDGHWAKTDSFPLSRFVPGSRQVDVYVPFVFFGIRWEDRGGIWA